ncbi:phosphoribosylglycinamide formyltransferase 2 [Hahella chejuensis KCTC 2396]|uniref:Formate-dependent phosphoribosylglycinamide formyltransferase n=1 Tax=Hahella chejuensis (strain KCTC 2396) TaxID=349521 RepID=PURT_HAHCH|nr:formate-dependent phosphoribosylglycinamide formyltransferase [Hahella chejuensis]Q2SJZ8.1 RecName: Full=Formate-dependent phosphoribosylglycinamide formyltransferase; AltName: Full=5'-phosphoribosylglycinamide transformylase 2; AltName: Full=Formate-dependent GAR transformylase; AltName: Full=GAR transformylase 2; Short=GART 2; AltName: Full=Non-folate glycinamide ribonucleotide transformylase; AltName: Full=Phosphoribosylglycinamide formyltransferase 2 [Hahella chejuensis KCTC 2396]ABC29026.
MVRIGTPLTDVATRAMLLGSGELGKEVAIELQRFGVEVIAVDRYSNAPAMQVAHRAHVIDMLDPKQLRALIELERPDFIIPEIEAIATAELLELERSGFNVVPSARAANLTMNREGIRRLAAEELGLSTSPYAFAADFESFRDAVSSIGVPCVVKPIMSSSGKGQSVIHSDGDVERAWRYAQEGGRAGQGKVIVEGFVDFDYEVTLLTLRHAGGTSFCDPIGHLQVDGDYRVSWQPHPMSAIALGAAQDIAEKVTVALGGCGIFGVELFVKGDEVYFSEVSPRPHDTGLVTLVSQNLSEFALHARALLGLPVPLIKQTGASASVALLVEGDSSRVCFSSLEAALCHPEVQLRLFGKPEVHGKRRMGVVLAQSENLDEARKLAQKAVDSIVVELGPDIKQE